MEILKKKIEPREKNAFYLCSILFFLFSLQLFSQDSIPAAIDLTEEKELKFQEFFFKALSDKSIGNHQKSIESLESCNQILQNNSTVYYEFSKNYLSLNKFLLAKEYIQRALRKKPTNIWMLKHLVKIDIQTKNFKEAIKTQKIIANINPTERALLIKLFLQNNEIQNALDLLTTLEDENVLPSKLKGLKDSLESPSKKKPIVIAKITDNLPTLINQFITDKSYKILEQILQMSSDNQTILKYSEEGVTLFPAQPYVYLMKGKALNYQKNYKKALTSLQSGIDFVIEDTMEINFYNEMAVSYKGLGRPNEEIKYLELIKKLKK